MMKNTKKTTGDGDKVKTTTAPLPLTQFPVICDEAPEMASPLRQFTDAMHEAAGKDETELEGYTVRNLHGVLDNEVALLKEAIRAESHIRHRAGDYAIRLALIAAEITRRVK